MTVDIAPVETERSLLLNDNNNTTSDETSRSSYYDHPTTTKKQRRRRLLVIMTSLVLVGGILVGLALGMLVGTNNNNNNGRNNKSHGQTLPPVVPTTTTTTTSTSSSFTSSTTTTMRPTNSKYTKVQGLGFQIYTGGAPYHLNLGGDDDDDDGSNNHNRTNHTKWINPECTVQSLGSSVVEDGTELQCYVGHEDASTDVADRIVIMRDAVDRAYQLADPNPRTLKVFVAPEFYWRGVHGAYSFDDDDKTMTDDKDNNNNNNKTDSNNDCGPICLILKGMEDIVADERFEDWLFVFGTVIASEVLPKEDKYDFVFYNFAPVYKGYNPTAAAVAASASNATTTTSGDMLPPSSPYTGKRFLVPKRYVSSSDFLTPKRHLNLHLTREVLDDEVALHHGQQQYHETVINPFDFHQKKYDNDVWVEYKQELTNLGYAMIEYDWLMVDGLSMTIEICFDHDQRRALNSYLANAVKVGSSNTTTLIPSSTTNSSDGSATLDYVSIPSYQAQISVVSSAGMTVTKDSLALTDGGTIFLQDGLSNETCRWVLSDDTYEAARGVMVVDGGTEAVRRRAILTSTDVVFELDIVHEWKRHSLYPKSTSEAETTTIPKDWKVALNGSFSTHVYEPMITVYDPIDIANVTTPSS